MGGSPLKQDACLHFLMIRLGLYLSLSVLKQVFDFSNFTGVFIPKSVMKTLKTII